jgi:hypothetical protein
MTPRTAALALLVVGAALTPVRAHAQDRSVYPGDHVRITDASQWTGMVQGVSPDTIDVVPDGERAARAVGLASVRLVEISVGQKGKGRPFLIGALVGAAAGAGAAGIVSAVHSCDQPPDASLHTGFCETAGTVAVVASGLIGSAVGGAVGALFGGGEKWVRAALPARVGALRLRLRLAPLDASTPRTLLALTF